jgi:uncharacterized membrane protein
MQQFIQAAAQPLFFVLEILFVIIGWLLALFIGLMVLATISIVISWLYEKVRDRFEP